jgi:nitroreductase
VKVSEALASRRSVRAFLPTPVDAAVIRRVIERASRAPSGGNLQPWYIDVLAGKPLEELRLRALARLMETQKGEPPEYEVYPRDLPPAYDARRFEIGEAIYRDRKSVV